MAAAVLRPFLPSFGIPAPAPAVSPLEIIVIDNSPHPPADTQSPTTAISFHSNEANIVDDVPDEVVLLVCEYLAPEDIW